MGMITLFLPPGACRIKERPPVRIHSETFTTQGIGIKMPTMRWKLLYYIIKPAIPRSLQLSWRRIMISLTRKRCAHKWPIDADSGVAPQGWMGWPAGKRFALVLTHDVESATGQGRVKSLALLEREFNILSSFNFVPERYSVSAGLREWLWENKFEVGVHDLNHDGRLFFSRRTFNERSTSINQYIREWGAKGFRSGAMHHNLEWIGMLDIAYDLSTFDTDPFEPQSDGVGTIFPFCVNRRYGEPFAELPYTLAQDFTLFILLREADISIWKAKLDWIVQRGGMALVNVHPDYIDFSENNTDTMKYPIDRYQELLKYCLDKYPGQYWNALPHQVAEFILNNPVYARARGDESDNLSRKGPSVDPHEQETK